MVSGTISGLPDNIHQPVTYSINGFSLTTYTGAGGNDSFPAPSRNFIYS